MPAIRELADCRILRPLLNIAKTRLIAFLEAERQPFIRDPSNTSAVFERSRLRNTGAVPSGVKLAVLLSGIERFGQERAARQRLCDGLLVHQVALHPAGFAALDPSLALAPPEIAGRALSAIVGAIGGKPYPAGLEQIARLRAILAGSARGSGHTLGGCYCLRWRQCVLVLRELADAARPVRVNPGVSCTWDRRFNVVSPANATSAITVGYLGRSGVIDLNRLEPRRRYCDLPRLVHPVLPAVWDNRGIAAVPHLGYRREGDVVLPELEFRPINPLTQPGFTVV